MGWIVYSKDGQTQRCIVDKLEYNGEFMGACSVNITITSPSPIDFEVGDYLVYREERFEINYDPSELKQAAKNTYGEAFKYENIIFNSLSDELTRCRFLDYVEGDNLVHYSSLPVFSFYAENISALAERIQVNLDRIYKNEKKWTVTVHPEYVNTSNKNISVNNINVWDALALVNSEFGSNFIIRGRTITIGTAGIAVGNLFSYGKGNGLYSIQKTAETDQDIITRLRAYGSTRNMPLRYYNKLSNSSPDNYLPDNMAVDNLMLPDFPKKTLDPYIDSPNISKLGIREGTVYFDGSGDLEEIYPSMEGMTAGQLEAAGINISLDAGDDGNLDEVVDAEQLMDDGTMDEIEEDENIPPFTITLKDIGFDINDYLTSETATISMKNGMCGGREFEITKCEKQGNKYVLTCNRNYDGSLKLYFPYQSYNIKKGDKFVLLNISMPDVYIQASSQKLLSKAEEYLSKNDYVRYSYEPKVDEIFMARHPELHDSIKEGDFMLFEDDDLNINGSIIIDSLIIKEGYTLIPTYDIILRNDKVVGTLEKIQNQIDSISDGQGGGGLTTQQIQSIIKSFGDKLFLRKDKIDSTNYLLRLLGGLEVGEAIDSLIAGKGIIADDKGRIQADRMELRSSLTVLRLIINEIQAMAGDFSFSDCGTIEKVELLDDGTYRLTMEKRTGTDWTNLDENDVMLSIVNTLLTGGNDYYTSWFRCITKNRNDNTLTVVLYPDNEVPGGKNYPPVAGYNVTRRGNAMVPDTGEAPNERAQSWLLSSREGRIMFLQNVFKPILEDYNYALTLGRFPNVKMIEKLPIGPTDVGVMSKIGVFEKIYEADWNGTIIPKKVDRGEWSLATAQGDEPYRFVDYETFLENQKVITTLEQHTVYHYGCKWGCIIDKTIEEPQWNSAGWVLLEGDKNYHLDFTSTAGWQFFKNGVNTNIAAVVSYGNRDITNVLMATTGVEVEWLRDTGNVPADNSWSPTYVDDQKHVIRLTSADMGSEWGFSVRTVKFICRVFIPVGEDIETVKNYVGFRI